jgi:hypothetical protein
MAAENKRKQAKEAKQAKGAKGKSKGQNGCSSVLMSVNCRSSALI